MLMKKSILILVLFVFTNHCTHAQTWAQPGATWYYSYGNSWTDFGYHEIQKTGDTLINGFLCDKLHSTYVVYNYMMTSFDTSYGMDFTYISNDTLYHFYNNSFVVMAIFGAQVGDRWKISYDTGLCHGVDTCYFRVDSLGQRIYARDTLPVLFLSEIVNSFVSKHFVLNKKMGFDLEMFPYRECVTDYISDYGLRCYSDSSGFYYNSGIVANCDSTVGLEDIAFQSNSFLLYPNPNNGNFNLEHHQIVRAQNFVPLQLKIKDVYGRTIYSYNISNTTVTAAISVPTSQGIYFWELVSNKEILGNGKMIIVEN